jgi:hypothetical protein
MFVFAVRKISVVVERAEDKARQAVSSFLKALKNADLNDALKVAGAPFTCREGDGSKVLKDLWTLRLWLNRCLDALKTTEAIPTDIQKLIPVADFKSKIPGGAQRKAIEQALGDDGFVAIATSPTSSPVLLLVRLKNGQAKVVGIGGD